MDSHIAIRELCSILTFAIAIMKALGWEMTPALVYLYQAI